MTEMTPEAVTARLRAMSRRSASEASPMPRGVGMSPREVTARLRELSSVSALCRSLGRARPR